MPRSQLSRENLYDPDVALQTELDQVKDNNANPAEFVASTMNNWELWKKQNKLEALANDSNFTLYTPGPLNPYIEITDTTYKVFAAFIYRGTDIWTPLAIRFIASRSKSNGTSYVRIYDSTNAQQIVEASFTTQGTTLYTFSGLTNLPTNQSIFEIQARIDANNSGSARIHALGLYP